MSFLERGLGSVRVQPRQVGRRDRFGEPNAVRTAEEDMAIFGHTLGFHDEKAIVPASAADTNRGFSVGRQVHVLAVHSPQPFA